MEAHACWHAAGFFPQSLLGDDGKNSHSASCQEMDELNANQSCMYFESIF